MKISWEWSLETEAVRLYEMLHAVGNGFFHLNHFYPLAWTNDTPYLPGSIVYLPKLAYTSIPQFWASVGHIPHFKNYPPEIKPSKLSAMVDLIKSLNLACPTLSFTQTDLSSLMPDFINWIQLTLPQARIPQELVVVPSHFGTRCSFNLMSDDGKVVVFVRQDSGLSHVIEGILTSVLRVPAMTEHGADWGQTEFLVDYLIAKSSLNRLLPPDSTWVPTTLATTHDAHKHILTDSRAFLTSIQAPMISNHPFSIKNNIIYYQDQPLSCLTMRENEAMHLLIDSAPTPVTTDQLGNILFSQEDKFSLEAVNKAISRLRNKLSAIGICPAYLATASGTGYYLRN